MRSHPQITHGDQALALEAVIGHSGLRRQCPPGQVPVALAAEAGQDRMALARSQHGPALRRPNSMYAYGMAARRAVAMGWLAAGMG